MRFTAVATLILAAGSGAAAAQQINATPQQGFTPGQSWVVQQESLALASPYRLSVIAGQVPQERQNRALRQLPPGRPQRELR